MPAYLNDHWTLDLELGMREVGDEIARLALRCRPPFSIAVHGKWGSGKTSLLRYAMATLGGQALGVTMAASQGDALELPPWVRQSWKHCNDRAEAFRGTALRQISSGVSADRLAKVRVVPIWFNPWQHQGHPQPLVPLLQEIRAQAPLATRAFVEGKKLLATAVESGVNLMGELCTGISEAAGGPKLPSVKPAATVRGVGEAWEQRNLTAWSDAQRFNVLFEEAIARLLLIGELDDHDRVWSLDGVEMTPRRMVIFVDDLDRCSDAQAFALLESIKLYLQTQYCVFVFGLDAAAIRRAVERSLLGTATEHAQDYLDKIFQVAVPVPVAEDTAPFIRDLAAQTRLIDRSSRGREVDALTERDRFRVELLVDLLEPNPRRIKLFLHSLATQWHLRPMPSDEELFTPYVLAQYLRQMHPDVAQLIAYDPEAVWALDEVLSADADRPRASANPRTLFLQRAFRHTFQSIVSEEGVAPARDLVNEVVQEFSRRVDRHRTDTAFAKHWKNLRERNPGALKDEFARAFRTVVTTAGGAP